MKGAITISRDSNDKVRITLIDQSSRARFAELHLSLADFAMAIIWQTHIEGELSVRDLHTVGLVKVIEKRQVACPLVGASKDKLKEWLLEAAQEDGWIIDPYLGSQGSVVRDGNKTILNYAVKKYVPSEESL